ncbi:MATE family efflux transporter [Faecalibacterium prausnitzii]|uniref:MATE family efflux transporter n=1 Tax=Faecalibacterium prausnitzii TaxID=853 RepID=UPI00290EA189|nr:MATE family efflux transporter [Faecalibacterium prausnitzii]MDU8668483.1 MATE family efflux transporter [Faecalibacterium prausnitzii]
MNPKNKLAEMPVRPLLYTMAVPLMLSLLIQSLYNIVDSIFVAHLSETALTAASLVYAIQFLMIAIGVGTAVVNMIGGALRQLVVLVPCLWLLIRTMGIEKAWFAFWVSEVIACAYSLWATKKELRNKGK